MINKVVPNVIHIATRLNNYQFKDLETRKKTNKYRIPILPRLFPPCTKRACNNLLLQEAIVATASNQLMAPVAWSRDCKHRC